MPFTIHITGALDNVVTTLKKQSKNISREIANAVVTEMHGRIFDDGKAADGNQIGTYNSSYLKLRQKKYKRTADSKIIVSLTRKLENAFGVVEAGDYYGIGVIDQKDADKMGYVEDMKNKKIADLTEDERGIVSEAAARALERFLNEK